MDSVRSDLRLRILGALAAVIAVAALVGPSVPETLLPRARAAGLGLPIIPSLSPTPAPQPSTSPHATAAPGLDTIVAAPNGNASGDGSIDRPLDLPTALSSTGPARPGSVILLRGGIYPGVYTSTLAGNSTNPIVVRSRPSEWAVLDPGLTRAPALTIQGHDTFFRDFEVTKSDTGRVSAQSGPQPTDIGRGRGPDHNVVGDGVYVFGYGIKLINLVVHDAGNGVGLWNPGNNAEIYGSLVFHNGWSGADHPWGHGIYVQNKSGTKQINDSFVFQNFGYGIHGYSKDSAVQNISVNGVTSFDNGIAPGHPYPNIFFGTMQNLTTSNIAIRSSVFYDRPDVTATNVKLGYGTVNNGAVTFDNNVAWGGSSALMLHKWTKVTDTNNVLQTTQDGSRLLVELQRLTALSAGKDTLTVGQNTYYDQTSDQSLSPKSFRFNPENSGGTMTFSNWVSSTKFDSSSTYARSLPGRVDVKISPNRYEAGRANITVLNWARAEATTVDLTAAGLQPGQAFEIRDVQNFFGSPVASGVWTGTPVSLPLYATDVMQPIGATVTHTPSDLGTFVVLPK